MDVIKTIGTIASNTDLAVNLGGSIGGRYYNRFPHLRSYFETREGFVSGDYYLGTRDSDEYVNVVHKDGGNTFHYPDNRITGIRPIILKGNHPEIDKCATDVENFDGKLVTVVKYGEYPQDVVDEKTFGDVRRAGVVHPKNKFTFNKMSHSCEDSVFQPLACPEYNLDGRRFIFVAAKTANANSAFENRGEVCDGREYCILIKPIEWYVDDKTDTWISKKSLISGIPFDDQGKTDMSQDPLIARYLEKYFDNEMLQGTKKQKTRCRVDPYGIAVAGVPESNTWYL